jgi:hypothetical protein
MDYGGPEQATVNSALAAVISGVSTASFGEHGCADLNRRSRRARRVLRAVGATISILVTIDDSQVFLSIFSLFKLMTIEKRDKSMHDSYKSTYGLKKLRYIKKGCHYRARMVL